MVVAVQMPLWLKTQPHPKLPEQECHQGRGRLPSKGHALLPRQTSWDSRDKEKKISQIKMKNTYLIHTPTKRSIHKTVSSKYTTRHSLKEIPLSCHRIKTLPFGKIHAKTIHSWRFSLYSLQIRLERFGKISHLNEKKSSLYQSL